MISVKLTSSVHTKNASPQYLWQYDYGQTLEVSGIDLPSACEVHFATQNDAEAVRAVGSTADGVMTVSVPDACLEASFLSDYYIFAYIFITDESSGTTRYKIAIPVKHRVKGDLDVSSETEPDAFSGAVKAVEAAADRAEAAAAEASKTATVTATEVATETATEVATETATEIVSKVKLDVEANTEARHAHENKDILDSVTSETMSNFEKVVAKSHVHENKDVLDAIDKDTIQAVADNKMARHTHGNFGVLSTITEEKTAAWDNKSDFSGSYNDLLDKPEIPTVPTDEISANTAARHSHDNKDALDMITSGKIEQWDAGGFSGDYNDLTNKPESLKNPMTLTINTSSGIISYDGSAGAGVSMNNIAPNSASISPTALSTSVAIGSGASAPAESVVIGNAAGASNSHSVAIGYNVSTSSSNGYGYNTVVGHGAIADAAYSEAIGADANVHASSSAAIGWRSKVLKSDGPYVVSVGWDEGGEQTRRIIHVGTPTADSDAATKAYVDSVVPNNIAPATVATAPVGNVGCVVLGDSAESSPPYNVVIGNNATSTNMNNVVIGYGASASGSVSVALGQQAISSANQGVALGYNATASGVGGIAIGGRSNYVTTASAQNATAIGFAAQAACANSVALGANSAVTSSDGNVVSVGSSFITRKIIHVATPTADTDAANKAYVDTAVNSTTLDWSNVSNKPFISLGDGLKVTDDVLAVDTDYVTSLITAKLEEVENGSY